VWLVMTTGMRRGEVCALRWRHVDLDGEMIEIRRADTLHKGVGVEKDTKTHQMRSIALDSETGPGHDRGGCLRESPGKCGSLATAGRCVSSPCMWSAWWRS